MEEGSTGKCLVCANPLAAPVVFCADCDSPCHQECFAYAGRCSVYGCSGMRFKRNRSDARGVDWIELTDPDGVKIPQAYIVDFISEREQLYRAMIICGIGVALLCLSFLSEPLGSLGKLLVSGGIALGCGVALASWFASMETDDYRIIDRKTRKIWLHEAVLGRKRLTELASFDECESLVLRGHFSTVPEKSGRWWLELALRGGRKIEMVDRRVVRFRLFDEDRQGPPDDLVETSRRLSQLMGVKVVVDHLLDGQPPKQLKQDDR